MYSLISLETSQPEIWKTQTKKQIYNQFKKANKQTKTKQKTTTNSSCAFGSISFCLPRYNCYYSVLFLLITVYEHLSIFWEEKWITKEEVWKSTGNTFIIVANTPLLKLQKKKGRQGIAMRATRCRGVLHYSGTRGALQLHCRLDSGRSSNCHLHSFSNCSILVYWTLWSPV